MIVNGRSFESLTSELRDGRVVVHGWGRWPENSCLAGQAMKCFVDQFDTQEEADAVYPQATPSHPMMQEQNTFDHLPDTPDY